MSTASGRADARKHPRAELSATAVVLTRTRYVGTYLVRNLSAGGALFIGDATLPVGESIRILLHLEGLRPLCLEGNVVRRQRGESGEQFFAAAFRDVPVAAENAIAELVSLHLEAHRQWPTAVLVVDDCPATCRALRRDLRLLGREAVTATTPLEAVARLHSGPIRTDTVIVDARLGQADGVEFLAFLAEDQPLIRRVLMSGDLRLAQLELARASNRAHAFMAKPWDRDTLAVALG